MESRRGGVRVGDKETRKIKGIMRKAEEKCHSINENVKW